jgi:ATP-dependent Clp protease adaptor protein ClpS
MLENVFNHTGEDTEELLLEEIITDNGEVAQLIVYNDDVNTFDWVIQCLVEVCKHQSAQAEQLSLIVHFKGKATVKTGVMDVLKPMKDALCERGLSAVIETTCKQ